MPKPRLTYKLLNTISRGQPLSVTFRYTRGGSDPIGFYTTVMGFYSGYVKNRFAMIGDSRGLCLEVNPPNRETCIQFKDNWSNVLYTKNGGLSLPFDSIKEIIMLDQGTSIYRQQ
jgi:hypothetical protein